MTTPAETRPLPPFAEPYLPDFSAIERMTARVQGFILQPIEAPSPDLAHAFASWLELRGWTVELIELRCAEQFDGLVQALTKPAPSPRSLALVVAPNDLDPGTVHDNLAAVNWARDRIARERARPVLWWGNKAFHRMTWEHAPDLWSVAGPPYRIPLRRLADVPPHLPHASFWWTGAVNVDLAHLEHEFHSASTDGDGPRAAQAGLQLAEAQILRKDPIGAHETLARIRSNASRDARHLLGRLELLEAAASRTDGESPAALIERLRQRIADLPVQVDSTRSEVGLRLRLAEVLESMGDPTAVAEYGRARTLVAQLGDVSATLALDLHLTFDLWLALDDALIDVIVQHAATAEQLTGDPKDLGVAALIQAKAALVAQDLERAETLAQTAIQYAMDADQPGLVLAASPILTFVAFVRGDLDSALERSTAWIERAEGADNFLLLLHGMTFHASVLERIGRPIDAAHELMRATVLAEKLDRRYVGPLLLQVGTLARRAGDPGVAASLAAYAALEIGLSGGPIVLWTDPRGDLHDWQGHEGATAAAAVADFLDLLIATSDAATLPRPSREAVEVAWAAVQVERERLDATLTEQRVDPLDPDTWRVRPDLAG